MSLLKRKGTDIASRRAERMSWIGGHTDQLHPSQECSASVNWKFPVKARDRKPGSWDSLECGSV